MKKWRCMRVYNIGKLGQQLEFGHKNKENMTATMYLLLSPDSDLG